MTLSLSTCWMHERFESLTEFFPAAEASGFTDFELDASISLRQIANISLPEGQIPSLEVPCPTHPSNYDANFASLDRYERDAAREAALNSIQLAYDLKTEILIVKLGRVDMNIQLEASLYEAWQGSKTETETIQDLRKALIATRHRNAAAHLKAALHDVEYLATQAVDHGLKLGLVTPPIYTGFPHPEELQIILEEFGDPVFYWHDFGAAQIHDTLGLLPASVWLEAAADQTIGVHVHNTEGTQRGLLPHKSGDVDWQNLAMHLPENVQLTCKVNSTYEATDISEARMAIETQLRSQN